jgi:hypothetical protein
MSISTGAARHGAAPHAGTWTLTMPPPAKWLNANDRYKRRPDKEIRAWRDAARLHAHAARLPKLQRAHLLVLGVATDTPWVEPVREYLAALYPNRPAAPVVPFVPGPRIEQLDLFAGVAA